MKKPINPLVEFLQNVFTPYMDMFPQDTEGRNKFNEIIAVLEHTPICVFCDGAIIPEQEGACKHCVNQALTNLQEKDERIDELSNEIKKYQYELSTSVNGQK